MSLRLDNATGRRSKADNLDRLPDSAIAPVADPATEGDRRIRQPPQARHGGFPNSRIQSTETVSKETRIQPSSGSSQRSSRNVNRRAEFDGFSVTRQSVVPDSCG